MLYRKYRLERDMILCVPVSRVIRGVVDATTNTIHYVMILDDAEIISAVARSRENVNICYMVDACGESDIGKYITAKVEVVSSTGRTHIDSACIGYSLDNSEDQYSPYNWMNSLAGSLQKNHVKIPIEVGICGLVSRDTKDNRFRFPCGGKSEQMDKDQKVVVIKDKADKDSQNFYDKVRCELLFDFRLKYSRTKPESSQEKAVSGYQPRYS